MACQTRIVGGHIEGAPIYGGDHISELGISSPIFHKTLSSTLEWLCDGFRSRFNQQRSTRSKFVFENDEKVLDEKGKPVLEPIGNTVHNWSDSEARANCSWLQAIPAVILHAAVNKENEEWFTAAKGRKTKGGKGKMPRFKSSRDGKQYFVAYRIQGTRQLKDGTKTSKIRTAFFQTGSQSGVIVITGQNPKGKYFGRDFTAEELSNPKIKKPPLRWKIVIRVRFNKSNVPSGWSSVRIDLTAKRATFTQPLVKRHQKVSKGSIIAFDRGGVKALADSNGGFHTLPNNMAVVEKKRKESQRKMAKKRAIAEKENRNFWESKNYQRERANYRRLSKKVKDIRSNWHHHLSVNLVLEHDWLIFEQLSIQGMTRKGCGKHGMNRSFLSPGHADLLEKIYYKAALYNAEVTEVKPRFTSQRCSSCGFIAKENRESQAIFSCKNESCGFTMNADSNAAQNILGLALQTWSNSS